MRDVLRARSLLAPQLPPTPMWSYPTLNAVAEATVHVKHENTQPIGAFKVRGGLNLLAALEAEDRARGVVSFSTGNHAQSIAYAARRHGAPCTIVMPTNPNPSKARAVRALGATLVEAGANVDEGRLHAAELAERDGARLISPGNEPELIAGVATAYLEIIEQEPELDAIVVPVGSGTGAAGACIVAEALAPQCAVYAVQSASAPAGHDSWRTGELVIRPNRTAAEGLATGSGFELPQSVLRERLADFLLVEDAAIQRAQRTLFTEAHTLAEGAGAAALAAVLEHPEHFAGRRVAVMCSGGNASEHELRGCLDS